VDMIQQARYRIQKREAEQRAKQKRLNECREAFDKLEREEFAVSHPDYPKKVEKSQELAALRKELGQMMQEDFDLEDEYRRIVDDDTE
jgi:hypothetical protein